MNLPPANHNAVLLDQASGSGDAYQFQQQAQQQQTSNAVSSEIAQAQNIASIQEAVRQAYAGQDTPENKARAGLDYAAATLQMIGNSGQMPPGKAALAALVANSGADNPAQANEIIQRRIYG